MTFTKYLNTKSSATSHMIYSRKYHKSHSRISTPRMDPIKSWYQVLRTTSSSSRRYSDQITRYLHLQILLFQDCHLSFHAASVILSSFDLGGFDTIYVHVLDTHLCGEWVKHTAEYFFPYNFFSILIEMEIIDYLILQWLKI